MFGGNLIAPDLFKALSASARWGRNRSRTLGKALCILCGDTYTTTRGDVQMMSIKQTPQSYGTGIVQSRRQPSYRELAIMLCAFGSKKQKRRKACTETWYRLVCDEQVEHTVKWLHYKTGHGGREVMEYLAMSKRLWWPVKFTYRLPLKNIISKEPLERGIIDVTYLTPYEEEDDDGTTRCWQYLIVMVDNFTKMVWIKPTELRDADTIVTFLEELRDKGITFRIYHSDNGGEFVNNKVKQFIEDLQKSGIAAKWVNGAPHHPQSQGGVERTNKTFKEMLVKRMCQMNHPRWAGLAYEVLDDYLNRKHSTICMTPLEAARSTRPGRPEMTRQGAMMKIYQATVNRGQRNAKIHNKTATPPPEFDKGDLVLVKPLETLASGRRPPLHQGRIHELKGNPTSQVTVIWTTPGRKGASIGSISPFIHISQIAHCPTDTEGDGIENIFGMLFEPSGGHPAPPEPEWSISVPTEQSMTPSEKERFRIWMDRTISQSEVLTFQEYLTPSLEEEETTEDLYSGVFGDAPEDAAEITSDFIPEDAEMSDALDNLSPPIQQPASLTIAPSTARGNRAQRGVRDSAAEMVSSIMSSIVPAIEPVIEPVIEPATVPALEPAIVPAIVPVVVPTTVPVVVPAIVPAIMPVIMPAGRRRDRVGIRRDGGMLNLKKETNIKIV
ncbi:KRAB-A domain-containing protein 2-like [Planoprotostelium fungivorum]|uniref:KRAB-A domain-containing protein 2-like n=1 Tax=Planoprotostelium fungivorum TaxID=1890364 RepID=A0A2P6MX00_9EUKA|nr:KRAB-A domain-containing protein 2-like [Planoprotostelium fungivorum]